METTENKMGYSVKRSPQVTARKSLRASTRFNGAAGLFVLVDELFDQLMGLGIRILDRRGLHEIGRGTFQLARHLGIQSQFTTADGVDTDPRAIGRIPNF